MCDAPRLPKNDPGGKPSAFSCISIWEQLKHSGSIWENLLELWRTSMQEHSARGKCWETNAGISSALRLHGLLGAWHASWYHLGLVQLVKSSEHF